MKTNCKRELLSRKHLPKTVSGCRGNIAEILRFLDVETAKLRRNKEYRKRNMEQYKGVMWNVTTEKYGKSD